jgi:hypothetical protein
MDQNIRHDLIVELHEVVLLLARPKLHGGPRVKVHLARDIVRHEWSPFDRRLQRLDVVLQQRDDGPQPELRVSQEAQEQLHVAVSGPTAQAAHRGVDPVCAEDDRLDRIGKRELQIVVGVNADFLARAGHGR